MPDKFTIAMGFAGGAVALWAGRKWLRLQSHSEPRRVVRTPEDKFANLPDYPFAPNYAEVDGMRMHYVDEGPQDGPIVLLLHGEPSWSFLYRKMIPPLAAAGLRVIAPDLIGFGKSDKPTMQHDYSYALHVEWMRAFILKLQLTNVTLFCQDWGSLIGLRVVAENPELFARVVVGNGGLPTGDRKMPAAFTIWKFFAVWSPWFPIGRILQAGTVSRLSESEVAAYDAPFPSALYKAGARAFPALVPSHPGNIARDDQKRAWASLKSFNKPFLCTFSNRDPITRGADKPFRERVPGAQGREHVTVRNAGHFLQEDAPAVLVQALLNLVNATPLAKVVR